MKTMLVGVGAAGNKAVYQAIESKLYREEEIRNINKKDGTAGGGIWLNEKYQKNGYGTEAFSSRNKYCFDVLGLRRIENGYFRGNEKSEKCR